LGSERPFKIDILKNKGSALQYVVETLKRKEEEVSVIENIYPDH